MTLPDTGWSPQSHKKKKQTGYHTSDGLSTEYLHEIVSI
jgi:hypothetical protein